MLATFSCMGLFAYTASGKWYSEAVSWIERNGIDKIGTGAGREIDRNTFAMWVAKIESTLTDGKLWDDYTDSSVFPDVSAGKHYYAAIAYAKESGFIQGDGDGRFYPDRTVTFAEACALITRAMGYDDYFEAYYGADRTKYATYNEWYSANWQINYMRVAQLRCGAIDATWVENVGEYVPQHKMTKGEAAYMLYTLAHTGANVRHNGYDMGYKFGSKFADSGVATYVFAMIKSIERLPLGSVYRNPNKPAGLQKYSGTDPRKNTYLASYWEERNYQLGYSVPYTNKLDTTSEVVLQIFDGDTFSDEMKMPALTFQSLLKKGLGKTDGNFNALSYVGNGSVVSLKYKNSAITEISAASGVRVDTYRMLRSHSNPQIYINGLAVNSASSLVPTMQMPKSYSTKDVTEWNGNKLVFRGVSYYVCDGDERYTGINNEIKIYGYESVQPQRNVTRSGGTAVEYKYYGIGTGTVYWSPKTNCAYYCTADGKCYTAAERDVLIADGTYGSGVFTAIGIWNEKGALVPLTVAEAKTRLINAAQGEAEVIFSDMDGDGRYDAAAVTEYDAFFCAGSNLSPATSASVRGVPSAGTVVVDRNITTNTTVDPYAWGIGATVSNTIQVVFNVSDRRGSVMTAGNGWKYDFTGGARMSLPVGTSDIATVASFVTGYVRDVSAQAKNGYYELAIVTSSGVKKLYLPAFGNIPREQTLSYTLYGAKAQVTADSSGWMGLLTDFYRDNFLCAYRKDGGYVYAVDSMEYCTERLDVGYAYIIDGEATLVSEEEKAALITSGKVSESLFRSAKLRTVAGAIGLVGECDDIEEGYSIGIVIKQPKDDGIYSAADDESLAALIISWINNKYISYVADSDGKIIACKSVTNKTGEEGFIVNLTKNTSDNTYKVDLAITGESSINRLTGKCYGAVRATSVTVRASASTIWDIDNAEVYRRIYDGNLTHELRIGQLLGGSDLYYVKIIRDTGRYGILKYVKPSEVNYENMSGKSGPASEKSWTDAGTVTDLGQISDETFYLRRVTATEIIAGKIYYKYDAANEAYSIVSDPRKADLASYYERVVGSEVKLSENEISLARAMNEDEVDDFIAQNTYVRLERSLCGTEPYYRVVSAEDGKYGFRLYFKTVSESMKVTTYTPLTLGWNGGKYSKVYDNTGNALRGTLKTAHKMTAESAAKSFSDPTAKAWKYYSFGGVIYAELEPAESINLIGEGGTPEYRAYTSGTVYKQRESNVPVSDYEETTDTASRSLFRNKAGSGYALKINGKTYIVSSAASVMILTPDNETGKVVGTVMTVGAVVRTGKALVATKAQFGGNGSIITSIAVFGELVGGTPDKVTQPKGKIVFVGADAATVLNADETGTSYIVKTSKPAYTLDGREFGTIYYEYDTTNEKFDPNGLKFIIEAGSFYRVDEKGRIISSLGSIFTSENVKKNGVLVGTTVYNYSYELLRFDNRLERKFCGTATITDIRNGRLYATVDGTENVNISSWRVKFIYTDLDATKLYVADGKNDVSVSAFNEIADGIESKYNAAALARKVYEAARDGGILSAETIVKYKAAYEASVAELEAVKKSAADKMNGQFWGASSVSTSAIKHYFDSAKYTYGVASPTLTFSYLYSDGTYYVIVPSFAKLKVIATGKADGLLSPIRAWCRQGRKPSEKV